MYGLIFFLVLNTTFSNISTISWRPVLAVEEAGVVLLVKQTEQNTNVVFYRLFLPQFWLQLIKKT
jgi:hypothetical protein